MLDLQRRTPITDDSIHYLLVHEGGGKRPTIACRSHHIYRQTLICINPLPDPGRIRE